MYLAIARLRQDLCSVDMNLKRNKSMEIMFKVQSQPLFLHLWCFLPLVILVERQPFSIITLPTCLLYVITFSTVKCCLDALHHLFLPTLICHLSHPGSRTLTFAEHPSISTELELVESHIDFTAYNVLQLVFFANDALLILDCLFNHLICSDAMI